MTARALRRSSAGGIDRRRAEGKLGNLAAVLDRRPFGRQDGHRAHALGDAWRADRGECPSARHRRGYRWSITASSRTTLRCAPSLKAEGQEFTTETDTECVAQLLDLYLQRGMTPEQAAAAGLKRLEGAYALALIFAGFPDLMIGARHGAPLAVGFGDDEMFLGSDALALAPLTRRIAYLEDGDWTAISRGGARFMDRSGRVVQRAIRETRLTGAAIGRGNYRHFMEKELHEHPVVIGDVLSRMIDPTSRTVMLPDLPFDLTEGTARHHQRLRLGLLRGAGRPCVAGGDCPPADGCRCRQRIPLPCAAPGRRGPRPARQPVGRDRRYARRPPLHAG